MLNHEPDWINTIFLSTCLKAWRTGGYNEYLYTFFNMSDWTRTLLKTIAG
nr:hypothetical protein [Mycobacterium leprae]